MMSRTSPSTLRRKRGLGQARPDRRGDVGRGRALGHFLHRPVGKRDLEHLGHVRCHVATGSAPLNSIGLSAKLTRLQSLPAMLAGLGREEFV